MNPRRHIVSRIRPERELARSGFTLVEILAASAIMLIVVGAVLGFTTKVLDVWADTTNKLSGNADARQAFNLIVTDIESAVIKNDGNPWMEIVQESVGSANNVHRLYFYSNTPIRPREDGGGNPIYGSISAINYRLVYQNPFGGTQDDERSRYALHRGLVDPEIAFENFLGVADISGIWGAGSYDLLDADLERQGVNADTYVMLPFNLAALNIVDFQVVPLAPDPSEAGKLIPITNANQANIILPQDLLPNEELVAIRVSIRVINNEGDQLLRFDPTVNITDLTDGADEWLRRYTDVYVRTIPVTVAPY